ncbi:uncharacterized protein LOC124337507 isoform X4 [Daphnia pulicaria]|uniref:uncharacterized protein LOC124337507 isoform X4 n=1 Tax=Daphnia pulicaria TaxID=35523 RepID=UPI001EEC056B|nr:uncharacterized protein LOC124337507 isoform X4 [Daphnia pulicaria]
MTAAAFSTQRLIGLRLLAGRAPATYWPSLVLPLLAVLVLLLCWKPAGASEFPERECCDDLILLPPAVDAGPDIRKTVPLGGNGGVGGTTSSSFSTEVPPHSSSEHPDTSNFLYPEFIPELSLDLGYPLPPPPLHPHHQHPHPGAPDGSNYVPTTTGTGLHQGQPASAILNCLLAHQLCAEDPSCKSIETVIQHICGPETVACSTTTVTKCQAGLRTLQAFPVFHPTCLCREPSVDPDCNAFRDSLFDHPCMVATQKERDLYPIHALPTCTHALDVCQKDLSCTRLYNDFREHCKLRSGVCRDKETCYNAWRGLRMTPLFGCFCPGNDQKKCERIYSFIYNNTCVAGGDEVMDGGAGRVVSIYQSTCHRALTHCQSDLQCRKHLDPFLRYCNGGGGVSGMAGGADTCHRDLCMQALQGFYKDAPLQWSLEVAFCVCKKSQSRNDECLVAQERLHPDCARRPERYHLPPPPLPPASSGGGGGATAMGGSMASSSPALGTNEASPPHHTPACHHLAEECKAHPDCKPRLEFYVQACAVDIVTKGCAGPPSICRRAVLDILGTDLRTTCTCRTAQHLGDMAAMYDCTEWQRLLWLNPCVVEAQRDFHKIQGNLKVVTVPTPTLAPSTAGVDGSSATVRGRQTSSVEDDPLHHLFTIVPRRTLRPQETQQSPGEGGGQRFPMTSSTDVTSGSSSTVTWTTLTGTRFSTGSSTASGGPTTTEMITRPTIPAKYCTLERSNERVVHFPEGTIKRLYDDDDPDCSELCRCGAGQVVTCSISDCADRIPCQTSSAVYAHAATAFQAYRGECLCFSGTLVCARPDPGQYSLPLGVFLFVGYSRADEKAIYQFTHTNVSRSLVTGLDRLMYISLPEMAENECRMSIHDDKLEENLIFQIRLSSLDEQRVNNSVTLEMLTHEKSQCLPVANRLRHMISKRLPDIREDEALSIIKVADTATVLPEPRRSASANRHQMCWTILAAVWSSSLILTNRFYS